MKKLGLIVVLILGLVIMGASRVEALIIFEIEGNDTIATAQNIDAFFSIGANVDIQDSATIPWVSISATGDGTYDYYSFTVASAGSTGVFDIDYGMFDIDTEIGLFDPAGLVLAQNDDFFPNTVGAGGSAHPFDSYISHTFAASGLHTIGVSRFPSSATTGTLTGAAPHQGSDYTLQVSIQNHDGGGGQEPVIPEPLTLGLFGSGLLGLLG